MRLSPQAGPTRATIDRRIVGECELAPEARLGRHVSPHESSPSCGAAGAPHSCAVRVIPSAPVAVTGGSEGPIPRHPFDGLLLRWAWPKLERPRRIRPLVQYREIRWI